MEIEKHIKIPGGNLSFLLKKYRATTNVMRKIITGNTNVIFRAISQQGKTSESVSADC